MPHHFDILIRQARLRGLSQTVDIGMKSGNITALAEQVAGEAELIIDAEGNLVLHLKHVQRRSRRCPHQAARGFREIPEAVHQGLP